MGENAFPSCSRRHPRHKDRTAKLGKNDPTAGQSSRKKDNTFQHDPCAGSPNVRTASPWNFMGCISADGPVPRTWRDNHGPQRRDHLDAAPTEQTIGQLRSGTGALKWLATRGIPGVASATGLPQSRVEIGDCATLDTAEQGDRQEAADDCSSSPPPSSKKQRSCSG